MWLDDILARAKVQRDLMPPSHRLLSKREFTSAAEQVPGSTIYEGQAPSQLYRPGSSQVVWDAIAARHPRKFKRAVRYVLWLDRMERRYEKKVL